MTFLDNIAGLSASFSPFFKVLLVFLCFGVAIKKSEVFGRFCVHRNEALMRKFSQEDYFFRFRSVIDS